jgi:hypothetical protein
MVPFTIQMLYGSSGHTQEASLGLDAGTHHIGVSATTEKSVLFEAGLKPRTDIKVCFVFGRRSSGYFDLRLLDGTRLHASLSCKKLSLVQKASALLVERRAAFPPAE